MVANHGPPGHAGSIPAQGVYYHNKAYKLKSIKPNMEKDIGKIKKNDDTDIVVRVDDFGGKIGLTIREYTNSERYTGFTKSGTRIPLESIDEFKTMINSINPEDLRLEGQAALPEKPENQETPEETPETEPDNTI